MPLGNESRMLIVTSGEHIAASRVMLFPEPEMQQVLSFKAKAQEELGGFTTGLGFWGSPAWVIGGAATLGFVESLISNSKIKKGLEFLKQAALLHDQLKTKGLFVPISEIDGIAHPHPAEWRSTQIGEFRIDLKTMGFLARAEVIKRYNISRKQITDGIATVVGPAAYISDGDEFVWIEVEGQPIAVRWSSVDSYQIKTAL